jgi:adenylate cyclase
LSGYIDVSTSDTGPRLKAAARKALELDKSLAEPHAALGFFAFWYAGDWSEGRRELESALELSPNDVTANHWYSHYLTSVGRSDEAIAHIKRVMDMDPVSRDLTLCEGNAYYYARRYDEAIATCQKALAFDSTVSNAHWLIADCWVAQSMYDKAFDQLRRLGDPDVEQLREAYQKAGTRGFWQKQLELAFDSPGVLRVPPEFVGGIYSQLGMNDRAFEWLDECRKKGWPLVHMKVDPNFDNVRSDPRFGEFLRTMGLHE